MTNKLLAIAACLLFGAGTGSAQQAAGTDVQEVAKKLSNPVASLISVPFQNNFDMGIGALNGYRYTLNFQPVVPFQITEKVNLVTRTIVPVVSQKNITGAGQSQSGLSDIMASAFFGPSDTSEGLIFGGGPVFSIPTAGSKYLGTEKFCVGPTLVAIKQMGPLAVGGLTNQIWSVAGNGSRADVSQFFLQPFVGYSFKSGAALGLAAEMTKNWKADTTSVVLTPSIGAVTRLGKQLVNLAVAPRFTVSAPAGQKTDIGIRAAVVLVFPK